MLQNLSLLGILTSGVLVRFIAACFSLEIPGIVYGAMVQDRKGLGRDKDTSALVLLRCIFHVRTCIRSDKRSSEPKR